METYLGVENKHRRGILLFERVVSLEIRKAYEELKNVLLKNDCKIITEELPKRIIVEHGSLWGSSPKGAKKRISFNLISYDSKTRIVSVSSLDSDWISVSVLGYVLLIIFIFIFGWMAMVLEARITVERQSLGGWLAEKLFGYAGYQVALAIADLLRILAIIFFVTLIVDIIIGGYIYVRKDSFSKEILNLLP